jgi:2-oxoglutarate ferredoxin oxidoreductase subunit alpha
VVERKKPTGPPEKYKPFTADADGVAPLSAYGSDYIFHVSSSMHGPDGYSNNDPANAAWRVEQLHRKIEMNRDEIVITKTFATEDADVLLVAFGGTTGASRAAALDLRKKGVKAGVLQLITLWPFADKEVALLGSRAKTVVVTEMNYSGQVAGEVRQVLGSGADIRKVNSYNGQIITPQKILKAIG